jgi:hypothetical protein
MQGSREFLLTADPPPALPARFQFTAEERLLLACSWVPDGRMGAVQGERVAAQCRAGVDWSAFLDLVDRHRLRALAHLNLKRHGQAWVPPTVLAELADRAAQDRTRSLRLGAECLRLARIFDAAGLAAIPLRGALVAWQIYGDPALRQARHLDLLIPEVDLRTALALLAGDGYLGLRQAEQPVLVEDREGHMAIDGRHSMALRHPGRDIRLDLHWRLGRGSRVNLRAIWSASRSLVWLGIPVTVLEDAVLLACLCDHGAGRAWARCQWLGEAAMLVAQDPAPDWPAHVATARSLGLGRPLAQAALLVHWLYGVDLPPSLARLVQEERSCPQLAAMALDFLRGPEDLHRRSRIRRLWYGIRLRPCDGLGRPWRWFLQRLKALDPAWARAALARVMLLSRGQDPKLDPRAPTHANEEIEPGMNGDARG